MAEILTRSRQHETRKAPGRSPEALPQSTPEHRERQSPEKKVDTHELAAEARQDIAKTAKGAEQARERLEAAAATPKPLQPRAVNRELKAITLRRELQHIRRKESLPQRTLSRVIHQPAVRVLSEAAGKTVSRPSGLLGGGLVAFLGTSGYLYLANHLGFRYNYLVFLVLFAGGFIIGLILELMVYAATSSRRHSDS